VQTDLIARSTMFGEQMFGELGTSSYQVQGINWYCMLFGDLIVAEFCNTDCWLGVEAWNANCNIFYSLLLHVICFICKILSSKMLAAEGV
jgi:hypothetical protein